jgi:hypothetical protein
LKRKNAAKRNTQTVSKYIRAAAAIRPRYSTPWHLANIQRDRQGNEEAWLRMKTPMARGRLWPKRGGELSELAFFYKAASLGFGVAKPWGDSEP